MIKYGFQTYTWQMSYEKYADKIGHILDITRQGGLHALEPDTSMLKGYFDAQSTFRPDAFKELLAEKDVELAALCLICDWLHDGETAEEKLLTDKAIQFVQSFPNPMLMLCQMPQNDRSNLEERQKNALKNINAVAKRAMDFGIRSVFHPNSPPGSIFRIHEDYKRLLDGLDSRYVGYAPDSGHIINGGMDVYDIFTEHLPIIKHVHFKDIGSDNVWRVMGEGITDFVRIIKILQSGGFEGYVLVEDESPEAEIDPDGVTLKNSEYLKNVLLPIGA